MEHDPVEHEHDHERLRSLMLERLINIRSMSTPMKVIVAFGAAQLLAVALLIVFRNHHFGKVVESSYFSEEPDKTAQMPWILFFITLVFSAAAWSLIATAATRAGWIVRAATIGALALAFGAERTAPRDIGLSTTLECLGVGAVIVLLLVLSYIPERNVSDQSDPRVLHVAEPWKFGRSAMFGVFFVLFMAMYALVWHGSRTVGQDDIFVSSFADQLNNIQWLLIPVITMAGADFADWGSVTSGWVVNKVRIKVPQVVYAALALLAAAAIAFDGIRISRGDGAGIQAELLIGLALVAITAGLLALVRPRRGGWPQTFPVLVLAALAFFDSISTFFIGTRLDAADPNWASKSNGWDAVIWLGLGAVALVVMVVRRGKMPTWLTAGAVFTFLIGVMYIMTSLYDVTYVAHPFGLTYDNAPYIGYEGLKAVFALVTIAVMAVALVRGKLHVWRAPIAMLLVAAISFQVLEWVDSMYGKATNVSGSLAVAGAAVMIMALTWEFVASGESITNLHHRRFPRDARVMIFLGYIVLVAATSAFFGSIHDETGKLVESPFEAENYLRDGIIFLGTPLVLTIFIMSFGRWRAEQRGEQSVHAGHQAEVTQA